MKKNIVLSSRKHAQQAHFYSFISWHSIPSLLSCVNAASMLRQCCVNAASMRQCRLTHYFMHWRKVASMYKIVRQSALTHWRSIDAALTQHWRSIDAACLSQRLQCITCTQSTNIKKRSFPWHFNDETQQDTSKSEISTLWRIFITPECIDLVNNNKISFQLFEEYLSCQNVLTLCTRTR